MHQRVNEGPAQVNRYMGRVSETGPEYRSLVVHADKIRPVEEVKCFSHELQSGPLLQFELLGQAHINIQVIRPPAAVAAKSQRTIIGRVAVVVDIGATGEHVERMSAAVA